jgi:hypothetical protein
MYGLLFIQDSYGQISNADICENNVCHAGEW